jgi:hypothetical protein
MFPAPSWHEDLPDASFDWRRYRRWPVLLCVSRLCRHGRRRQLSLRLCVGGRERSAPLKIAVWSESCSLSGQRLRHMLDASLILETRLPTVECNDDGIHDLIGVSPELDRICGIGVLGTLNL